MANIYEQKNEDLHKLLDRAKGNDGATVLIPDLQRPFVWTPNQVVLLVDSLIRGWPFGTLLMWKAGTGELERIPHRQFWQVVDRTEDESGTVVSRRDPPASFHMVLDGQQRLQSLLLALGGDNWGFKLSDRAWRQELQESKLRGRGPKYEHWSKASLCFDIQTFLKLYLATSNVQAIDYRAVLRWIITDPSHGQSTWKKGPNYIEPLTSASTHTSQGRFIRLSRLWAAVSPNLSIKEKQFREEARILFTEHSIPANLVEQLLEPAGELMSTIRDVKLSKVTFLELQQFEQSIWSEDEYNDAIVNIFTRLNTAGRTLTRQEITLAWLKVGWQPQLTDNRNAGECFASLQSELETRSISLDIDDLVMAVSYIWSVSSNNGQLLANRDLLKGPMIQPMAQQLSKNWGTICESILEGLDRLRARQLLRRSGGTLDSVYPIAVLWSWLYTAKQWLSCNPKSVVESDSYTKTVRGRFDQIADRWLFGSLWASHWAGRPSDLAQKAAKQLAATAARIKQVQTCDEATKLLTDCGEEIISDIKPAATSAINSVAAFYRSSVSTYSDYLWIWHRINKDRWKQSRVPLRADSYGATTSEVDHLVPVGLFTKIIADAANGDEQKIQAMSRLIHQIGNCSLLEKSFNIAKSDQELASFLETVHEFKNGKTSITEWATALSIDEALLRPNGKPIEAITSAINAREAAIKSELREFLEGRSLRHDVT